MDARIWLHERGHLHDGSVTFVRPTAADGLDVGIDDEWVNERGLSRADGVEEPVVLRFEGVEVVSGSTSEMVDGTISSLEVDAGGDFRFVFCDRPMVVVRGRLSVLR